MKKISPDFFVVGTMKSGTTWLMECLNYHPEITCFNELMILTKMREGIGKILNNVNTQILDGATTTFSEFVYPVPEFVHNDVNNIISVVWDLLINKTEKKSKFFGEKSPDYTGIIEDIVQWYPAAKYIHIVRDPRDVALSYYHHYKREARFYETGKINQIKDLSQASKKERSMESLLLDAITIWKADQTIIETMKIRFPDRFLTVRYEDMKNPKTLNSIFSFIGAKTSKELCECIIDITDVNERPKSEDTFFKYGKSCNWKTEIGADTIDYLEKLLGNQLKEYAY